MLVWGIFSSIDYNFPLKGKIVVLHVTSLVTTNRSSSNYYLVVVITTSNHLVSSLQDY